MKPCSRCHRTLPLDAYAKRKASKDGRQSWCRDCQAERNRDTAGQAAAYSRALRRLRLNHPAEFQRYYQAEKLKKRWGDTPPQPVFQKSTEPRTPFRTEPGEGVALLPV